MKSLPPASARPLLRRHGDKTVAIALTTAGEAAWSAATATRPASQSQDKHDEVLAALQAIAATPKEGGHCPEDPRYQQSWDDEGGRYAIDKLHELIDLARKVVRAPARPAAPEPFSSPIAPLNGD
ncbi:hypothetical protein V5F40_22925 [Xanthobacter sp. DSM 14520]|uniref:hypothetical protein n=1 Tax=Xanthobacter autotrophicus (strain ATCC BAA-1158 / Py2) TaxID=78245 RepID=UPI003729B82B